jgi:Rieske Fe-S protein
MTATVTRRSALTAAAAAAVGVVIGVVYGRNSDAAEKPARSPYGAGGGGYGDGGDGNQGPQVLAKLSDVPENGGVITSGVVVTRGSGDTVHAFSSSCTHLGCEVNKVASGKIFCPCHGSVFDASTGDVVQGPASSPLPPVAVKIENGDVVTS